MKQVLEQDIQCWAVNENQAVIGIKGETYVFDYDALMEFLQKLAVTAAQVENFPSLPCIHRNPANLH